MTAEDKKKQFMERVRFLKKQDWDSLTPRLLAFAGVLCERRRYYDRSARDWVLDAITAYLEGKRKYQSANATFFEFLCGAIRSRMHSEIKSNRTRLEYVSNASNGDNHKDDYIVNDIPPVNSIYSKQLLETARKEIPESSNILGAILYYNMISDSEIAKFLQITPYQVRQGKKAIKTMLSNRLPDSAPILNQLRNTNPKRSLVGEQE